MEKRQLSRYFWLAGVVVLFFSSWAIWVFPEHPFGKDVPGCAFFILGWMGVGIGELAWFANPLIFIGWLYFVQARYFLALRWSISASVFALQTYLIFVLPTWPSPGHSSRAFWQAPIHFQVLGPGFYLWLSSMVLTAIGAHYYLRRH